MSADWTALVEIGGTPATLASAGYEDRAAALQELVRDAHVYLTQGLDTDFAPLVVVADRTDWARGGDETPPYGIPYASDDGLELVIPADPRENFLVDVYAAHGSRKSAERFADLIAVHELGHLHVREMGLDLPSGWLCEFMATYLACCFLVAHRPEDAALWYTLSRAHAEGVSPEHRSLEVLDERLLRRWPGQLHLVPERTHSHGRARPSRRGPRLRAAAEVCRPGTSQRRPNDAGCRGEGPPGLRVMGRVAARLGLGSNVRLQWRAAPTRLRRGCPGFPTRGSARGDQSQRRPPCRWGVAGDS